MAVNMEPILAGFQKALFQNETKCGFEFPPAVAGGIHQVLWAATVDAEGFSVSNRVTGLVSGVF